ncbi:NTP transferase domain-containing protein [Methanospirillum stamsii]|uniref:5-deoxyadenosylcobinamide phosphate nucleotidyltransferase n=1 Tax=Methanospirillum stamsii TaxID=1277351 RepID=A0A2V2N646_9EURY|nr:NTP transferase domain-containing protein [Methanospirillum stamsii]PWR75299.1 5-deoxyadenosylcobinamide phosphate nucleotidyltransferase [Methanospirillum stamsii]
MYALILAGGKASRLGMGEKALVRFLNRPLLSYVIESVTSAGLEPFVIVTSQTPYTSNYCRIQGIPLILTDGAGYVEDIWQAVLDLSITGPFLTICADLPGITPEQINSVLDLYKESGYPACSVWTPYAVDLPTETIFRIKDTNHDIPGKPVGLNILRADLIEEVQDELKILIEDPFLSLNINTREELVLAEKIFSSGCKRLNQQPIIL